MRVSRSAVVGIGIGLAVGALTTSIVYESSVVSSQRTFIADQKTTVVSLSDALLDASEVTLACQEALLKSEQTSLDIADIHSDTREAIDQFFNPNAIEAGEPAYLYYLLFDADDRVDAAFGDLNREADNANRCIDGWSLD